MDFLIYKKFADYNDSELANYYVNFAYKCSDSELFIFLESDLGVIAVVSAFFVDFINSAVLKWGCISIAKKN